LDGHIFGQGAIAMPVGEAEHPLSHRESRGAIAEGGDHAGQLVAGDRRCSVTVAAIRPGRGPRHLSRDESRRMNLNDDVVYRCRGLGPLHQRHPRCSRSLVRHHDRLHLDTFLYQPSPTRHLRFTTASPTPNVGVLSTQIAWHPIPRSVYLTVHRADTWTAGPRHVFSATGGLDPSSPTSDRCRPAVCERV